MSELKQRLEHILAIEDSKGQRIVPLNDDCYSLGRASKNSIVIYSRQVSRYHATLVRQKIKQSHDYSYWIYDGDLQGNKSTNGLLINGNYHSSHQLEVGDLVILGDRATIRYYRYSYSAVQLLLNSVRDLSKSIFSKTSPKEQDDGSTIIL